LIKGQNKEVIENEKATMEVDDIEVTEIAKAAMEIDDKDVTEIGKATVEVEVPTAATDQATEQG